MNKIIKQFRYYGDNDSRNQPLNLTKAKLASGEAFKDFYPNIVSMEIQSLKDIRFYLNNSLDPITSVNNQYKINLQNFSTFITNLVFDPITLKNNQLIINFIFLSN